MFVNDTNVPLRNIFILKGLSLSSTEVIILNNNYLISGSTNKTDLLTNIGILKSRLTRLKSFVEDDDYVNQLKEMTKINELISKVEDTIRS